MEISDAATQHDRPDAPPAGRVGMDQGIHRRAWHAPDRPRDRQRLRHQEFECLLSTEGVGAETREFVELLAANHCYRVFMPIENPDIEIMHHHRKYVNIRLAAERDRKLHQVTGWLSNAGIEFYSAIMIGFPGETLASIRKALGFARFIKDELGALGCALHWVHPYPFTRMYQDTYHLIDPGRRWEDRPEYFSFVKPVFPIQGISLDDVARMVDGAFFDMHGSRSRNTSFESWRCGGLMEIR
jgi:hypothetical protein